MMSDENRRRLEARQERDRPKITEADVEEYRRVHYPSHVAEAYVPGRRGRPMAIPGDGYIAALDHGWFHEWFDTECDRTCPHVRSLPVATARRRMPDRYLVACALLVCAVTGA